MTGPVGGPLGGPVGGPVGGSVGDAAAARALRRQVRVWRRGRADTPVVEAIGDAYVAIFATLMLGSMTVSVILNVRSVAGAVCTSRTCEATRAALPLLSAVAVLAACLAVARLFGPMLVSPAVGSWLLASPVDRRTLLARRLAGSALVVLTLGALVSAGSAALAGYAGHEVLTYALSVGAACLLALAGACLAQAQDSRVTQVITWTLAAMLWLALVGLTTQLLPSLTAPPPATLTAAALGLAAVGLLATVRAYVVLPRLRRDQLVPGGQLVPGLSGALAGLDLALVYDILLARRWLTRSTVKPVRGRGSGTSALVWSSLVRLRRSPAALLVLTAALVLPYLAAGLHLQRATILVATATGFLAGLGPFSGVRVLARTPGLARFLPMTGPEVLVAAVAAPGGCLVAWGLGTAPALHDALGVRWGEALLVSIAVGVTSAAAAVRWMTGRPPDYRLPLVTSPMGAVPTSLYGSVARGFDVLILGSFPLLLAPNVTGAGISLALSGIVLSVLVARRPG